jgi:hypothetical protein
MSTHRHIQANATALTIAALLGAGALAGCSGAGSSSAAASGTASGTASAAASGTAGPAASASATPVPKTAPALLSGALATLRSAGSVHVETDQSTSQGALAFSDDSTASGGRQVIKLGTGQVTILFIAGVGYVQANAAGLAGVFQVPQQQADEFAGQWIALRPGEKLGQSTYDDVTAGITLSSLATELTPGGAVSLGTPSTVKSQRVLTLREPVAASAGMPATARAVLYVTDTAPVRPVLSEVTNAGSSDDQVYFSDWGETVHVTAPAHSVPASDVTSSSTTT